MRSASGNKKPTAQPDYSQGQSSLRGGPALLHLGWIDLLSRYHWDLFGSLTFRDATHPESAYKRFRLFLSVLNRKLYGPRWFKHNKGVSYCVAMERQARGVLHFHVLLADPELSNLLKGSWFKLDGRWANELNEMWNEVAGFARIEPIKALELVQRYVSKYVIKGGEIDLGGPLMQRRLEQATARPIAKARATGGRCLGNSSDSVPGLPVDGGMRGQTVCAQVRMASHLHSLEAGRASWSGLVAGTNVHGVTRGDSNLPTVNRG